MGQTVQQEERLRGTLAWMDLVMASIDESIFVVDKDWQITYMNDTLVELLGKTRVLLLGQPCWQILPLLREAQKLEERFDFSKLSIKEAKELDGVYLMPAFKTKRIMRLTSHYIPVVEQTAFVLTDVSIETRAQSALKEAHLI